MSIFGKIASAIFGIHPASAAEAQPVPTTTAAATGAVAAVTAAAAKVTTAAGAALAAAKPTTAIDVASVLDGIADKQDDDLDWRKSIVDLMKLLKLDSSLTARKQLAAELHYTGDMGDSAGMNVWLHKQVMTKLADNGGIVPAELKH